MSDSTTPHHKNKRTPVEPIPDGMRICGRCHQVLPATLEYFGKCNQGKGGLRSFCRTCWNAYVNGLRNKDKAKHNAYQREYYHSTKDIPERKQRKSDSGKRYYARNRDKISQYRKENRYRFRDKRKAYMRGYLSTDHGKRILRAQAARRRSRMANAPGHYTTDDVKAQYKSQKGCCWHCGEKLNGVYHIDHLIPLNKGGTNWPNNIVISCPKCNLSKQDKLPQEWNGRLL